MQQLSPLGKLFGMKILVGAAAATAALAIAAVPASFTLTSGGTASPSLDTSTTVPTSTETTETPGSEVSESPDITADIPTDAPTRGWEVDHPNNGQHNGWSNAGHDYGQSVKEWAKCVSTAGKENCDPKPLSPGQEKQQVSSDTSTTAPTTEPTDDPTAEPTTEPTDGTTDN